MLFRSSVRVDGQKGIGKTVTVAKVDGKFVGTITDGTTRAVSGDKHVAKIE